MTDKASASPKLEQPAKKSWKRPEVTRLDFAEASAFILGASTDGSYYNLPS